MKDTKTYYQLINLKIDPQISHTTLTDSTGEHKGPDELTIVISAENPIPEEEKELPIVVSIESAEQADHLIKTLQKLRVMIWGLNLNFDDNKN
ncbi:MAG: hypothetical protein IMZ64_01775 [Bacteroidetes bacterium]|nr:hypothetical protein [Bacteroidota bacterium]